MKLIHFIFALFLLGFITGCKKDSRDAVDKLPSETQSGKNTLGCLIDGKVFKPGGSVFGGPVLKVIVEFNGGDQGLSVYAKMDKNDDLFLIGFGGRTVGHLQTGVYELSDGGPVGSFSGKYNHLTLTSFSEESTTNAINKGELHIKFIDHANRIIAGTFWFDAKDNATGRVVEVREGRFDLEF